MDISIKPCEGLQALVSVKKLGIIVLIGIGS